MKGDQEIDAERLAALLDGRLKPQDRDEVLLRLADSDEELSIYADAIAASGDAPGVTSTDGVMATNTARRSPSVWRSRRGLLALAATLLIVVTVPLVVRRGQSEPDTIAKVVAGSALSRGGIPAQLREHPWLAVRGEGAATSPVMRAARVGVLSLDLEVALRAGDTTAATLANEVAELLADLPASAGVVVLYRDVAHRVVDDPTTALATLARARATTRTMVDADVFDLSAWAEATRVAAARGDTLAPGGSAGLARAIAAARRLLAGAEVADDARTALTSFVASGSNAAPSIRTLDVSGLLAALVR